MRRRLAATAETISAVALLLGALDGYAAWSVGLFGVDRIGSPLGYAGAVFLGTALVAAAYRRAAPLAVPRYVALLAAQPVLPLIAAGGASGSGGGSGSSGGFPVPGTATGTAALAGRDRPGSGDAARTRRVVGPAAALDTARRRRSAPGQRRCAVLLAHAAQVRAASARAAAMAGWCSIRPVDRAVPGIGNKGCPVRDVTAP